MKKQQLPADPFSRLRSGLWIRNLNLPKAGNAVCSRCGGVKRGRYAPKVPGTRFGMPGYPCCCGGGGGGSEKECDLCSDGVGPEQVLVEIDGLDVTANPGCHCENFNGQYVLDWYASVPGSCTWRLYIGDYSTGGLYGNDITIGFSLNKQWNGSSYTNSISVSIALLYYGSNLAGIGWTEYIDSFPITCIGMDRTIDNDLLAGSYPCQWNTFGTCHVSAV